MQLDYLGSYWCRVVVGEKEGGVGEEGAQGEDGGREIGKGICSLHYMLHYNSAVMTGVSPRQGSLAGGNNIIIYGRGEGT